MKKITMFLFVLMLVVLTGCSSKAGLPELSNRYYTVDELKILADNIKRLPNYSENDSMFFSADLTPNLEFSVTLNSEFESKVYDKVISVNYEYLLVSETGLKLTENDVKKVYHTYVYIKSGSPDLIINEYFGLPDAAGLRTSVELNRSGGLQEVAVEAPSNVSTEAASNKKPFKIGDELVADATSNIITMLYISDDYVEGGFSAGFDLTDYVGKSDAFIYGDVLNELEEDILYKVPYGYSSADNTIIYDYKKAQKLGSPKVKSAVFRGDYYDVVLSFDDGTDLKYKQYKYGALFESDSYYPVYTRNNYNMSHYLNCSFGNWDEIKSGTDEQVYDGKELYNGLIKTSYGDILRLTEMIDLQDPLVLNVKLDVPEFGFKIVYEIVRAGKVVGTGSGSIVKTPTQSGGVETYLFREDKWN